MGTMGAGIRGYGDTGIWRGFGVPSGSEAEAGVRQGEGAEEPLAQAWCSQHRRGCSQERERDRI